MFKLSRKEKLVRMFTFGSIAIVFLLTATFFIIKYKSESQASAAHNQGDTVQITKGSVIYYTNNDGVSGWSPHYRVKVDGKNQDAYCVEPQAQVTDDEVTTTVTYIDRLGHVPSDESRWTRQERVNLMKLTMFIAQTNDSNYQDERTAVFGRFQSGDTLTDSTVYVFSHAMLSVLYGKGSEAAQYHGLGEGNKQRVDDAIAKVKTYIDNNRAVWQSAQNYKMYLARMKDAQDIVWIEYNKPTGKIIVQKCDAEITSGCVLQGNATNFDNITFELYNGTTFISSQTLTNGNQTVTFSDLDVDTTYTIKESGSNTFYNLTATDQAIKPATDDSAVATFRNTIKKGSLTINKVDAETGTCTPSLQSLSFAGTKFQLYNKSVNSIVYNNNTIVRDGLVAEVTFAQGQCSATIDGLPYGTYELKEIAVGTGYMLDSTPRTITVPDGNNNPNVSYTFPNQPIRGDVVIKKYDTNNNRPMPNTVFKITSLNQFNEKHIVVTDSNGIADTRANPHSRNTNGYDELYYGSESITYAGYGTWFGLNQSGQPIAVNDNVGALPYGTYRIEELKCDSNLFCYDIIGQEKQFTISQGGQVVQIEGGQWGNDCFVFSLATTATDKADGDKFLKAGEDTVIKDVVRYNAKSGHTYTIKGILMDKETGNPLLINGETIEQSVEISPQQDEGEVTMEFPINTSDLAGKSVVVYETLYYKNEVKASHENINDEGQTIDIVSLSTTAVDNTDNDHFVKAGENTTIKDTISYCVRKGRPYTITGTLMDKETGQPLLIGGNQVTRSITFTPENNCGTVDMLFEINSTSIAGKSVVVYEKLFYNDSPVISHENIEDEGQTVDIISLGTTATDKADDDHYIEAGENTTIKDTISYCVRKGRPYTVTGTLMDKETGQPLLIGGNQVTNSITFTPENNCGTIDMLFEINSSDIAGKSIVVYEKLFYSNTEIISHEEINDEDQTVDIVSLGTTAVDNADEDKFVEAGEETEIKDIVSYCTRKGVEHSITGILMDKSTSEPLLVDDEEVTVTVQFTPTESCGTIEMIFPIDTTKLAGKSIVVYETLYREFITIPENPSRHEKVISHEEIEDEGQTINVVSLGTTAVDNADEDKFIEAGEETVIKDVVEYCAKAGSTFTIKGILMDKETEKPLLINDKTIEQSTTFTPTENCGTVDLLFTLDSSEIASKSLVVYESMFIVTDDSEEPVISHEVIDDEDQTVTVFSINTSVKPKDDGTKVFPHDSDITITDTVHYCLKPGLEYTVKGIVMDQSTGNAILVNNAPVEQSVTFTPTEACGELEMVYKFNTTGLDGAKLIIFESLYLNNELLTEHKDLENEPETFEIDMPAPDTGFITKPSSTSQGSTHQEYFIIPAIAIAPVIIYTASRYLTRKRFLGK